MEAGTGRLLTVYEVAQRLGVCVRSVRGYIKRGALHVIRLGRSVRVAENDLADFILRRRS